MAPLTGDAGFLGVEQLSWAKYAVQVQNKLLGLKVGLYQGDTQLDPALASTLAQKYVSDPKTMAIIGPSTSGAVVATGPTFAAAKPRGDLPVGHPDVADDRQRHGRQELLPRRAPRRHPGAERRRLHDQRS